MKAYRVKKVGQKDSEAKVVIVNNNHIPSGYEKVGGPIGGNDILPLNFNEKDEFVPFKLDDGTTISNAKEMREAFENLSSGKPVTESKVEVAEVIETITPDEDDEPASPVLVKRRGRPAKREADAA